MFSAEVLKLVLRPVVRFFVRHSHSVHEFHALSKTLFVEEAELLLKQSKERTSVSRISAMTGLNRRDIAHIREHQGTPWHEGASVIARVLALWQHDARFCGSRGKPRELSFSGEKSEFSQLVSAVSRDLHAGTVLRELLRSKLVVSDGRDLRLVGREAIHPRDESRGFQVLSRDLNTLIKVASGNICNPQPVKHLHLRTEFDNIEQAKIPELKTWLIEQGRDLHRRAREFLVSLDLDLSSGSASPQGGGRVVLSTFGLAEVEDSPTPNLQSSAKRK